MSFYVALIMLMYVQVFIFLLSFNMLFNAIEIMYS